MRVYALNQENEYSCQICQREVAFAQNHDYIHIIEGIFPVCSKECQLLAAGKVLNKKPNSELLYLISLIMPDFKPKGRSEAIEKVAIWFVKMSWEELK